MTKEEALKQLKEFRDYENLWDEVPEDALDIAIKALEQEPVLDKIKEDFINRYPKNYANELELGGRSCVFSLNDILNTIAKYEAESEDKE